AGNDVVVNTGWCIELKRIGVGDAVPLELAGELVAGADLRAVAADLDAVGTSWQRIPTEVRVRDGQPAGRTAATPHADTPLGKAPTDAFRLHVVEPVVVE